MQSFEFSLGSAFLAIGSLHLLLRWGLESTRLGQRLNQAGDDWPRLIDLCGWVGVLSLVAGSGLTLLAIAAYAGL